MCWKKILCLILGGLFLFSNAVCQQSAGNTEPAAVLTEATAAPTSEPTSVLTVETKVTEVEETAVSKTPIPTPEPTEVPTPEPTPVPTETPVPTRVPFSKEGDITDRFPDYDTGVDADYSYQSDEMRIAVRKYVNPHDPDIHETYYIADIWIRNINYFKTGFGHGQFNTGREDGEGFASREHAILASNGTMNTGLVFHNGVQFKNVDNSLKKYRYGIFLLYNNGTMKSFDIRTETLNFKKEVEKGAVHAWQFGPLLIRNGEIAEEFSPRGTRHPRIMVGYYEPGHYVIVAVDGRNQKKAIGMNDYEMAQLMHELGCKEAMNFDGGTSAMMVFMGECISNPSGVDTDGDGKAGRNISDMLLFAEYDPEGNAPSLQEVDMNRIRYKGSN